MVVDEEVEVIEVADASSVDGTVAGSSVDDEEGRYGKSGRVLCGSR